MLSFAQQTTANSKNSITRFLLSIDKLHPLLTAIILLQIKTVFVKNTLFDNFKILFRSPAWKENRLTGCVSA